MRRDESTPPVAVQTSPVPTQAMHSRNPRRSIRSMCPPWVRGAMLFDDDRGSHVGVKCAEVLIAAGSREGLRERLFVAEPGGRKCACRGGDRVRFLVVIRPPDGRAGRHGQYRWCIFEAVNADVPRGRCGRMAGGQQRGGQPAERERRPPTPDRCPAVTAHLVCRLLLEKKKFYQHPGSDYGRLSSELFRAVRLVVDTGIHSKGWTR